MSETSLKRGKKFARGGLCPRAAKTLHSSWERQQGFKIQSVPAPGTGFHLPAMRARRVRRVGLRVLAAFPYTLFRARGRSPSDAAAFYCSPWAETPTGRQAAVWLCRSGRLGAKGFKIGLWRFCLPTLGRIP